MKKTLTKTKMKRFRLYLITEEKSSATVEKYTRDMNKLYDFLPSYKRFDKKMLLDFKEHLIQSYKVASVNSILSSINSFLAFMHWNELRLKTLKAQRPVFCSDAQQLNIKEYKNLLRAAKEQKNNRIYFILLTICSTGIRVGELPFITREAILKGQAEVHCKNKIRTVLIPEKIKPILLEYAASHSIKKGPLFITRGNRPVNRSNIWADMKKLSASANIGKEKVYPHNLRHLFARTYYEQQKDIVKLADILGHTSISTTRIYTMSTGREHALQITRMNLIL